MAMTPEALEAERIAVLAEIHGAFANVSREGGVSWSEAYVIDNYGTPEECATARAKDTDRPWSELIMDPCWSNHPGMGGFSFLDPIGCRYYLPPTMCRVVMGVDRIQEPQMTIYGDAHDNLVSMLTVDDGDLRTWKLEKWSLLDDGQRRAVARFIRYMIARHTSNKEANPDPVMNVPIEWWTRTYGSYWHQFE